MESSYWIVIGVVLVAALVVLLIVLKTQKNLPGFSSETTTAATYPGIIRTDGTGNLISVESSTVEVPKGAIVMWSGTTAPTGWAICNGQNGTPNLSGKFILGWNNENSYPDSNYSENELKDIGGKEEHELTIDELPSHSHKFPGDDAIHGYADYDTETTALYFDQHNNAVANGRYYRTWNTGGGKPHSNMPPYFVLAYIMKIV